MHQTEQEKILKIIVAHLIGVIIKPFPGVECVSSFSHASV